MDEATTSSVEKAFQKERRQAPPGASFTNTTTGVEDIIIASSPLSSSSRKTKSNNTKKTNNKEKVKEILHGGKEVALKKFPEGEAEGAPDTFSPERIFPQERYAELEKDDNIMTRYKWNSSDINETTLHIYSIDSWRLRW